MGAAAVGVVDGEDVTGVDVVAELLEHRLALEVQRADVHGDVLVTLHDGVALGVAERGGEVARVDNEGVAGAQNLLGHEVDRGGEGVLENLEGHWVERAAV